MPVAVFPVLGLAAAPEHCGCGTSSFFTVKFAPIKLPVISVPCPSLANICPDLNVTCPEPAFVGRRFTVRIVPEGLFTPPSAKPSNFIVPPVIVGSVTQKLRTEFVLDTDSTEKIEAGNITVPETALNGALLEVATILTEARSPVLKLPVAGTIDRSAAYTIKGEKVNRRKNVTAA